MYKKILVPLDGSARAERILPHVEELAHRLGSELLFMQVVVNESAVGGPHESRLEIAQDSDKRRVKEAESYLSGLRGEFRARGIGADFQVVHGEIVRRIIMVAEEESVDLIAMASHGRSGLSRVFYGSVAAGVLQRVSRPLLVVRSRQDG
jgi:nucleotide-binding universal stress UspA family protein